MRVQGGRTSLTDGAEAGASPPSTFARVASTACSAVQGTRAATASAVGTTLA